jgi:hypothetical protein
MRSEARKKAFKSLFFRGRLSQLEEFSPIAIWARS